MAGTIPLSMTQQFDVYGKPLSGGQLYIIQAGTVSTPQDAFQDTGLSIKQPYPMTLDAAGRVPQFFVADGTVKIRLQDKAGVVQLAADSVLVIGPSAGGGGGVTVDPTQLIQTANMILRYGVGPLGGYVRLNGLTIGSAGSGATERANSDCQNLFQYLWGADPNLTVSGGRGATALADWTANKQIATPDWRGYALGALDDMGNTAAGRLSVSYFGASPITLGAAGGGEWVTLTAAQMPIHYHVAAIYDPAHAHPAITASQVANTFNTGTQGNPCTYAPNQSIAIGSAVTGVRVTSNNGLDTTYSAGGGAAHRTIGPRKLCTVYIKL
jgi:microcystin-dependent protein